MCKQTIYRKVNNVEIRPRISRRYQPLPNKFKIDAERKIKATREKHNLRKSKSKVGEKSVGRQKRKSEVLRLQILCRARPISFPLFSQFSLTSILMTLISKADFAKGIQVFLFCRQTLFGFEFFLQVLREGAQSMKNLGI